jgi:hypothetical protein
MRTVHLAGPALIAAALLAAIPLSQVKAEQSVQPHSDGVTAAGRAQDATPLAPGVVP